MATAVATAPGKRNNCAGMIINPGDIAIPRERCAGCPNRGKAVGPKGPIDSPFVIVGESPGARELAAGVPFVGPSGKMLEETLSDLCFDQLGIRPYITNALQCLPKEKELAAMKHATGICRARLLEEIQAYPRQVILTLGASASWSILNNFDIKVTMDRGKIYQSPLAEKGVVVTVHPAFMMRAGGASYYGLWKKDLADAIRLYKGEHTDAFTPPTWSVVRSRDEYTALLQRYADAPLTTGDVETDSLKAYTGRMLMLGITRGHGDHVDIIPEDVLYNNWDLTTQLVENPRTEWNWHNGKFDIQWFMRHGANARVDEDTMLLSYADNENRGRHDLDQVALREIRAPAHKGVMNKYYKKPYGSLRHAPEEELHRYAAYDISKTHRIRLSELPNRVLNDKHLQKLYRRILIPASSVLARIEQYGVLVSKDTIRRNEEILEAELAKANEEIQVYARKHVGKEINVGSWQQVGNLLYDRLRLGAPGTSTDEKHLIKIRRTYNHPIVEHLLKYREIAKLKGTYVSNLWDMIYPDGRIRASFLLHGTQTGRLAAREPNILNQPRTKKPANIRAQYVAGEGKIFVEIDLNQAELRSLALMSGDPLLMQIYTENVTSIHDVTTSKFFGSKEELATNASKLAQAKAQLFITEDLSPSEVYAEAKMRGKAVNFGIVYGREAFSLAEEFDIPVEEAQRWINAWFELYPGAANFIRMCREAPTKGRTLITNFGRKKRWGVVSPENLQGLQNEAANFPHQSTASDIMLLTAIEIQQPCLDRWGANIWNELYDAVYFEMDADDRKVGELISYVQSVIRRIPRDWGLTRVPFLGDAKVGYTWGEMSEWKGTIQGSLGDKYRG